MRTATGLALIALGAILAFAISAHPSFLNIQVAGVVLILTGIAGMAIPRSKYGWMLRKMVRRRGPGGSVTEQVEETPLPPYMSVNPEAATITEPPAAPAGQNGSGRPGDLASAAPAGTGGTRPPADEVVEEYLEPNS